MKKVLIWDTSLLCVYVKATGKETCGSYEDKWDFNRVANALKNEYKNANYILPIAPVIETGNHITNSTGKKYEAAQELEKIIKEAANANTPWALFTEQNTLWSKENMLKLAEDWPKIVNETTIGDFTIKNVAEYYFQIYSENKIEIFTADIALKSYEPEVKIRTPRRRSK